LRLCHPAPVGCLSRALRIGHPRHSWQERIFLLIDQTTTLR
jgi:hypothetical protein